MSVEEVGCDLLGYGGFVVLQGVEKAGGHFGGDLVAYVEELAEAGVVLWARLVVA